MLRRIEVMEAELDAGGNAGGIAGMQDFRYTLRKFCNHSENFAKLGKFSLCTFFRYDSEISLS